MFPLSIKKGINSYKGVRRRFEIKKNKTDIFVVDDYAHHPTEVEATINAAKNGWNKRIFVFFSLIFLVEQEIFLKNLQNPFSNQI